MCGMTVIVEFPLLLSSCQNLKNIKMCRLEKLKKINKRAVSNKDVQAGKIQKK